MNKKGTPGNLGPPWKPGESGNPGGRPKKRPITDEYFALTEKPVPEKLRKKYEKKWGIPIAEGTTFSQMNALARNLAALEKGGHSDSKEMREAMEGRAPMRVEITGVGKVQTTLEVIFRKRINQSSSE